MTYRLMVVSAANRQAARDRVVALPPKDGVDWVEYAGNMFRAQRTDAPTSPVAKSYLVSGDIEPEVAAVFPLADPLLMFCLDTIPVGGPNTWLATQGNYPVYQEF